MATASQEQQTNKSNRVIKTGKQIISNKQSRSTLFLILSIIAVLALNALLPLIEGGAHYTEDAQAMPYIEYEKLHEENDHYMLTYATEARILLYKNEYRQEHPDMSIEDVYKIRVPDEFEVKVYTEFFYTSRTWYTTTAVQIISIIIIFYSLFNYLLVRHKLVYRDYVELNEEMHTITTSMLDPVTFEPWMHNSFNRKRKIAQHIANVKYELDKLQKKTNYKVRIEYKQYMKDMRAFQLDPENHDEPIPSKKLQKYLEKKAKLNDLLDKDYIEDYVVDGKVKHFVYIQPAFVLCGVNVIGATTDAYSLIDSDMGRIGKQAGFRVVRIAIITIALALVTTLTVMSSIEQSWYWIVINIITKIMPLGIQIINAYDYRDNFMTTQLIPNLQHRRSISFMYMADMKAGKTNGNV